ncbi:MAG: GNAT family N-acetyltransferase [Bacillaceae bacterium]|nr:GNAT family N-acetyltransferase [Bacillaceae bacterium]
MFWFEPRQIKLANSESILIRSANPFDADDILTLSYDVISENDTLITKPSEMQVTKEQQRQHIEMYNELFGNLMLVAFHNHSLIGLLTFQRGIPAKLSHQGTLGMIINKKWRNKGVGKQLISALISWAKKNKEIEKICLEVLSRNKRAIRLYESFGFIEEGRQLKQVKISDGEYDDLILMGKLLKKRST